MSQYTSYYLYQKYEKRGEQDWIPVYPNTYSIDGDGTMPLSAKTENDPACGYVPPIEPIYRWYQAPSTNYICNGYNKYHKEYYQVSNDNGITWTNVVPEQTRQGSIIQYNSTDCGYVGVLTRWIQSGTTCYIYDLYNLEVKQESTDGGINWHLTSPVETRYGSLIERNSDECGYTPIEPIYRWTETSGHVCDTCDESIPSPPDPPESVSPYYYDYFTFEAIDTCQFSCVYTTSETPSGDDPNWLRYSLDDGETWNIYFPEYTPPTVVAGNKILWKCSKMLDHFNFYSTGRYNVVGNMLSLFWGDDFVGKDEFPSWLYPISGSVPRNGAVLAFSNTWKMVNQVNTEFSYLINAKNLILPVTRLIDYCYEEMFHRSFNLVSAPKLPATNLSGATYCYEGMFASCTNLPKAPVLPATTLSIGCYKDMFSDCITLTVAPELPAEILVDACYERMFIGCSNIKVIRALCLSDINELNTQAYKKYTLNWVDGVYPTGIFVRNSEATWTPTWSVNTIPYNWDLNTDDKPCEYKKMQKQVSYDSGATWENLDEFKAGDLIKAYSIECGFIMPDYEKWVNSGTTCKGYDKYELKVLQTSEDGYVWTTVSEPHRGQLLEQNSPDCGFFYTKAKVKYYDSTTYTVACNSSTTLTLSEVRGGSGDYSEIYEAEIGACVTEIGFGAFSWTRLRNIQIPSGITLIDDESFAYCYSLSSVTIPNTVTSIGAGAFFYSTALTSVTMESKVPPTLGSGAFDHTKNSLVIYVPCSSVDAYKSAWPAYANRIQCGAKLYATYSNLAEYTLKCNSSTTLTQSEVRAFSDGYWLTGMTTAEIGDCVTEIGDGAFQDCVGLTSVIIPSNVTRIGSQAFMGCSGLTSVTLNSTTPPLIGSMAFWNTNCIFYVPCSSVESYRTHTLWSSYADRIICYSKMYAKLSDSTTCSIACNSSTTLTSEEVRQTLTTPSAVTSVEVGVCTTEIGSLAFSQLYKNISSVTLSESVTHIGSQAFYYCTSLKSIVIPDSVITIDNYAFEGCSGLSSCTIGSSVTSIGGNAFRKCNLTNNLIIPNSVTNIGASSFRNNSNLKSVTIGNGVTSIGGSAFLACSGLTSITVYAETPPSLYNSSLSGTNDCPIYVPCNSVNAYKEASGWSTYASRIQCNNRIKTTVSVSLANTPTRILSSTTNVSEIEIDSVKLPSVTSTYTFSTRGEHTIFYTLKDSSRVGETMFWNCNSLRDVIIPTSVMYINNWAFAQCKFLRSVIIPNSVTQISSNAFMDCSGLTEVNIPDSVFAIASYAFIGCSGLTNITIGSGIYFIDAGAFEDCKGLLSITIKATTPPMLGNDVFYNTNNCPIYVPAECVDTYKTTGQWMLLANRIEAIST